VVSARTRKRHRQPRKRIRTKQRSEILFSWKDPWHFCFCEYTSDRHKDQTVWHGSIMCVRWLFYVCVVCTSAIRVCGRFYRDRQCQFVAMCCSVLQCIAVCCSVLFEQIELQAKLLNYFLGSNKSNINQIVCCSVLQCDAVCCSVLQYAAVCLCHSYAW